MAIDRVNFCSDDFKPKRERDRMPAARFGAILSARSQPCAGKLWVARDSIRELAMQALDRFRLPVMRERPMDFDAK